MMPHVMYGLAVSGACGSFVVALLCAFALIFEGARCFVNDAQPRRAVIVWFSISMIVSIFVCGAFHGFANAVEQAL